MSVFNYKDLKGKRIIINSDGVAEILKDDINVLIAIPCTNDMIKIKTIQSIYKMNVPKNVNVDIQTFIGYGCDRARNMAACEAINKGYEYILYIDSDQIVPADSLERLLAIKAPISAGWSMMNVSDERTNIGKYDSKAMFYDFVLREDIENAMVIDVDAIGFSCVLINTNVFKQISYPWFKYVEYANKTHLSEDLFFCDLVKKHGFPIMCDLGLVVSHIKTIVI